MVKIILTIGFFCLLSTAYTAPIVEDEDGNQYLLVPLSEELEEEQPAPVELHRQRRQVYCLDRNNCEKPNAWKFQPIASGPRPLSLGGKVGYQHPNSGSGFNVGAVHSQTHWGGKTIGTSVNADGRLNLYHKNGATLDAVGRYQQSFGGLMGTTKPQAYGGIEFKKNF